MNLAIEYALRTGILKQLIKLPLSLFIYKIKQAKDMIIITIGRSYGSLQNVATVKHWQITQCDKKQILPPYSEYTVPVTELFHNDKTIVPTYNVLEYECDPFPGGQKQMSDPPYDISQEDKYLECINNFFNTKKHQLKRKNVLWSVFMEQFLPNSYREVFLNHSVESQQNVIAESFPVIWKGWLMWNKYLLNCDGVAPELVFSADYRIKLNQDGLLPKTNYTSKIQWTFS